MKIVYKIENDLCTDIQRIADNMEIPSGYTLYSGRELPTIEELSTTEALDAEDVQKRLIKNLLFVENWMKGRIGLTGAMALIITVLRDIIAGDPITNAARVGCLAILDEIDDAVTLADAGAEKTEINTAVDVTNIGALF